MVEFRIPVVIDPSRARRGARSVGRSLSGVENQANRLRTTLSRAFAFLGGGAAFAGSVRLLSSFSQEMSTVRAVTGATTAEFERLRDRAADLGTTTRFTATQAAEGMVALARAGFSTEQVLTSVNDTLTLAQAGALDLGRAAEITAGTLGGFRLEADQAGRVADVLASAANSALTNVSELGEALKFVAPVAAGLNIELEETTAALGVLADAKLSGTLGGTGLRKVLADLESPTNTTRKALERFGVTADEVRVSQVGLVAALQRLRDAGVDAGTGLEIFGQRGGPAFEVLSNSIPRIEELNAQLREAEGTAQRVADVMDDNLQGALLSLKSAVQGLVIEIGNRGATGALRGLVEGARDAFRSLKDNVETVINVLESLIFVLGVRFARQAIGAAIAGLARLRIALLTNPIGVVATGLTLATAALVGFSDEIQLAEGSLATLEDFGVEAFKTIREAAAQLVDMIGSAIGLSGDVRVQFSDILLAVASFSDATIGFFIGLEAATRNVLENLVDFTKAVFNTINGIIFRILKDLKNIVEGVGAAVGTALDPRASADALDSQVDAVETAVKRIKQEFTGIGDTFQGELAKQTKDRLIPQVPEAEQAGQDVAEAFILGINSVSGAKNLVLGLLERAEERARRRQEEEREQARKDAEEQARKAAEGGGPSPGSGGAPDSPAADAAAGASFESTLAFLRDEADLIRMSNREREVQIELRRILDELEKEKVKLLPGQEELIKAQLEQNQALADQAEIVEQILGPQRQLEVAQAALSAAYQKNTISLKQYEDALLSFQLQALESSTDAASGAERAFLRIQLAARDHASTVENTIITAYDAATDAIADFALSGFQDLHSLQAAASQIFAQIAADLAKLAAQQALTKIIPDTTQEGAQGSDNTASTVSSILGILTTLIGGAAEGTLNARRGQPIVVGERGPELFRPRTSGTILPSEKLAEMSARANGGGGGSAPTVNVAPPSVTVQIEASPNESFIQTRVLKVMDSSDGQKKMVENIGKNKRAVRQVTS